MRTALTISLLGLSSIFMTIAWYAHLKFKHWPLVIAIAISWSIAFVEYCFQVPANRMGHKVFSAVQLKVLAEFFTLVAFFLFNRFYLEEPFNLNAAISFILILLAVWIAIANPF